MCSKSASPLLHAVFQSLEFFQAIVLFDVLLAQYTGGIRRRLKETQGALTKAASKYYGLQQKVQVVGRGCHLCVAASQKLRDFA